MSISERMSEAEQINEWGILETRLRAWLCYARTTTRINAIPGAVQNIASLAVLYFGGDRSDELKEALHKLRDLSPSWLRRMSLDE